MVRNHPMNGAAKEVVSLVGPATDEKTLANLRGERSLRAVARAAGVSSSVAIRAERGVTVPTYRNARRLAEAYGITVEEYLDLVTRAAEARRATSNE